MDNQDSGNPHPGNATVPVADASETLAFPEKKTGRLARLRDFIFPFYLRNMIKNSKPAFVVAEIHLRGILVISIK
jgi:hypothetical protein